MISILRRCLPLLLLVLVMTSASSSTQCRAETIRSFDVDVHLRADASLDVTENIAYNFAGARKHGIFRNMLLAYNRGLKTIDIKLQNVTNEKNTPRTFVQKREKNQLLIRIGDADKLVSGVQIYRLRYVVKNAVNFFSGAPEVYWNATGNQWGCPIQKITARFYPPQNVALSRLKFRSFRGAISSKNSAQNGVEKDCLRFSATKLRETEGLTFVVSLPKNAVAQNAR